MYGNKMKRRGGFTLTELLVVIGLIAVLMGILIPVAGTIRKRAYQTRTVAMIQKISSACHAYFTDFQAYPGIFDDAQIYPASGSPPTDATTGRQFVNKSGPPDPTDDISYVTSSENLSLSLLGGAAIINDGTGLTFKFDKKLMRGGGVQSLNQLNPKAYSSYIDYNANEMSPGQFYDSHDPNAFGLDSVIPEFVDSFPEPMPIIYIRARPGGRDVSSPSLAGNAQYNEQFLQPYWRQAIPGNPPTFQRFPTFDKPGVSNQQPVFNSAADVFASPSVAGQPRGKDTFILIAAGASRQYGTRDMIFSAD